MLSGIAERVKTNRVGENPFLVLFIPQQIESELAWDQTQNYVNSNNYIFVMFLRYNKKSANFSPFFIYLHGYSISQAELKWHRLLKKRYRSWVAEMLSSLLYFTKQYLKKLNFTSTHVYAMVSNAPQKFT